MFGGGPPKGFSNQELEDELAMVLNGGKRPAKKPQQKNKMDWYSQQTITSPTKQ